MAKKKKGKGKASGKKSTSSAGGEVPSVDQDGLVLNPASLPPFSPTKDFVQCTTGPMPTIMWAFTCNVPPITRLALSHGNSNASLALNSTPAMQWNFSMFHLAHHYGSPQKVNKFNLEDEEGTKSILLEVTALRACPDSQGEMRELSRDAFCDPQALNESLGPLPLFFVNTCMRRMVRKSCNPNHPEIQSPSSSMTQS
jgi:hypothetical protein